MTDEQRRDISNLFIVCGKHHDIIDDKNNENDYPGNLLRKYKRTHEGRFKKAERQLLKQFVDTTQIAQPTYPNHLRALAKALGVKDIADHKQEIRGVHHFIDNLKELPLTEREFALNLAQRMRRRRKRSLPAEDVMGAFQLSAYALRCHMSVLEDHQLGSIDEQGQVTLSERERRSNPWIEILEFCEKTGHSTDELIQDLNFGLYDG
jgi:hypothetical protein